MIPGQDPMEVLRKRHLLLALLVLVCGCAATAFRTTITPIDSATAGTTIGRSWRPECPVPIADLRLLTVRIWGFDDQPHVGHLVVHQDVAVQVGHVFEMLFDHRFPIERLEPVADYGGDDVTSMTANNSSAFNCRPVAGRPGVWSQHSYGRALDLNPVQNPFVGNGIVSPPNGGEYENRTLNRKGMIHDDDSVVQAFRSIGWEWGGQWQQVKDYQHFSANGK